MGNPAHLLNPSCKMGNPAYLLKLFTCESDDIVEIDRLSLTTIANAIPVRLIEPLTREAAKNRIRWVPLAACPPVSYWTKAPAASCPRIIHATESAECC